MFAMGRSTDETSKAHGRTAFHEKQTTSEEASKQLSSPSVPQLLPPPRQQPASAVVPKVPSVTDDAPHSATIPPSRSQKHSSWSSSQAPFSPSTPHPDLLGLEFLPEPRIEPPPGLNVNADNDLRTFDALLLDKTNKQEAPKVQNDDDEMERMLAEIEAAEKAEEDRKQIYQEKKAGANAKQASSDAKRAKEYDEELRRQERDAEEREEQRIREREAEVVAKSEAQAHDSEAKEILASNPPVQEGATTTTAVGPSSLSPYDGHDHPYTVVAENFGPGTTAAVIKNAFQGIGGRISCCEIVATNPIVIAEVTFVEHAGAENVIQVYNGTKVSNLIQGFMSMKLLILCQLSGRSLHVYWKSNGENPPGCRPLAQTDATKTGAVRSSSPSPPAGLDVPFIVVAQNFALGTTAADIESVFRTVSHDIKSCRLVAPCPTVIAEITFATRAGGDKIIDTFNGKKVSTKHVILATQLLMFYQADGRLIYVFWKYSSAVFKTQKPSSIPLTDNDTKFVAADSSSSSSLQDSTNTKKKERQAARKALNEAWIEREKIRVRVAGTWTLDGVRVLEEKSVDYNERRKELKMTYNDGQLTAEDAISFPYLGKGDISQPKVVPPGVQKMYSAQRSAELGKGKRRAT
jgi:hypothetical protein